MKASRVREVTSSRKWEAPWCIRPAAPSTTRFRRLGKTAQDHHSYVNSRPEAGGNSVSLMKTGQPAFLQLKRRNPYGFRPSTSTFRSFSDLRPVIPPGIV